MADNRNLIVATSGTGADGLALIWMAATGSTAPTDSTSALAAAWKNMGGIAETGASIKQSVSTTKKKFFGSPAIQRTIVTDQETTIDTVFGETNARTQEVYWHKALGSITPATTTGVFATTGGTYIRQLYALVVDMVDGVNHMRFYCPQVEVTSNADVTLANSDNVAWGVTFSAYPDTSGNYIYPFFAIPSLG